jgi:hypothetical protein
MTGLRSIALLAVFGMPLACGCRSWTTPPPALPVRNSVVLDQLVVYSDFPLPQHHRLLEELTAQRAALNTKLALKPSDEPIHVYLFPTPEQFKAFMRVHYADFPDRRAFFVESDTRLMVYAFWGDHVAEDLRHEVAHGYLHSAVPHLPLWLDEGLAEYFEVPRGNRGLNRPHVQELTAAMTRGWQPDLRRLENLQSAGGMTQMDYAESWAWVHLLLETTPERQQFLQNYLRLLDRAEAAEPLANQLRRLHLDYELKLTEHVRQLGQGLR